LSIIPFTPHFIPCKINPIDTSKEHVIMLNLSSLFRRASVWLCPAVLTLTALGQFLPPTYEGRPFVQISRAGISIPQVGFIRGYGSAQFVGDDLFYIVSDSSFLPAGLLKGRGGPQEVIASLASAVPGGADFFTSIHFNFSRLPIVASNAPIIFVGFSPSRTCGLYQSDGTTLTRLADGATDIPNSSGLKFSRFGEPHHAGSTTAFLGFHRTGDLDDFRGVYLLENGAFTVIADSNTTLPGGIGKFEGSSSQVGFDGETVAFWGFNGISGENGGMFAGKSGSPLAALAVHGQEIPGTGQTIHRFMSPPVVHAGAVYFIAFNSSFHTFLLKSDNGALTTLLRHGDPAPDGGTLQNIAQTGFGFESGRLFFGAASGSVTGSKSGIFVLENGAVSTILDSTMRLDGGEIPSNLIFRDVEGSRLIVEASFPNGRPAGLYATLSKTDKPAFIRVPSNQAAEPGQTLEFRVEALGADPLTFFWRQNNRVFTNTTAPVLSLPSVTALNAGNYSVIASNQFGQVFSPNWTLAVNSPPLITKEIADVSLEVGDSLALQVAAAGLEPITYSWFKDGAPFPNTNGPVLVIRPLQLSDAGNYQARASNALGTAMSRSASVRVLPAPPNPSFDGRQFNVQFSTSTLLPGLALPLDSSAVSSVQIAQGALYFSGPGSGPLFSTLFRLKDGATAPLFTLADIKAAIDPAVSAVYALSVDPASGAVLITAPSNLTFNNLFRFENGQFTKLLDAATPVPGQPGKTFGPIHSARLANGHAVIAAMLDGKVAFYGHSPNGLSALVDASTALPDGLPWPGSGNLLGFNGSEFVFTALNNASGQHSLYLRKADGALTLLAKKGDPIEGAATTFLASAPVDWHDGAPVGFILDSNAKIHVVSYSGGKIRPLAKAGDALADGGAILTIESGPVISGGTRLYFQARVSLAGSTLNGVVALEAGALKPVLLTRKLDGLPVNLFLQAADASQVVVQAQAIDGSQRAFIFANAGGTAVAPPTLQYQRTSPSALLLNIPDEFSLESTPRLGQPWSAVPGIASLTLDLSANPASYFRLRQKE